MLPSEVSNLGGVNLNIPHSIFAEKSESKKSNNQNQANVDAQLNADNLSLIAEEKLSTLRHVGVKVAQDLADLQDLINQATYSRAKGNVSTTVFGEIRKLSRKMLERLEPVIPDEVMGKFKSEVGRILDKTTEMTAALTQVNSAYSGCLQLSAVLLPTQTNEETNTDTISNNVGSTLNKVGAKERDEESSAPKQTQINTTQHANAKTKNNLSRELQKANLRLFAAVKMLESTLAVNHNSGGSLGSLEKKLEGVLNTLNSQIGDLLKDIGALFEHFKQVVTESGLGSKEGVGAADSTQITFTAQDDVGAMYQNLGIVAIMSVLFVAVDNAMIEAGQVFLSLTQQVEKLQNELAPAINLMTNLASQMQTLLDSYKGNNPSTGSSASPWSSASNLGFGIVVVPGTSASRTQSDDTSYGVYTVYPGQDVSSLIIGLLPNSAIKSQIIDQYNANPGAYPDIQANIPSLFPTIGAFVDALTNTTNPVLQAQASRLLTADSGLLGFALGGASNTGFYLNNVPQSLINISGGAILSPVPDPVNSSGDSVAGNWSVVTLSGVNALMKNISLEMHQIQMIDNGAASSTGTDSQGVIYDSLQTLEAGTTGLNNVTINGFVSNTLNSAATTLSSTQQDLSQFASKLVDEATNDILPLLQSAIQAYLKAFQ